MALWDDYSNASSHEARVVKALDKIETIIQHNQGANLPGFDHAFNLQYGRQYVAGHPVISELRRLVDQETAVRAAASTGGHASTAPVPPVRPS